MKKFTKILSLVLAVSLIASLFTVNVMAATQRTATIKIYDSCDVDARQEITTAKAGDTICVEITVDSTKNLEQIGYAMSYDADAFVADTSLDADDYEVYLDADWYYEHFENKKGDYKGWFNTFGTPTFTPNSTATGVKGVMNFQWAAEAGLVEEYENFIIGKFELKVADSASGSYTFGFVESNETTVTTTTGEEYTPFVANTATLKVGADAPTPSIDSTTANDQTGVAVLPEKGDFKYDNAYAVSVTLKGVAGMTEAGMEFVPAFVNDWNKAAKATFDGTVLGKGDIEYKAALINIPSKYIGATFGIMARPYYVADGVKTEGDPTTKQFTYTYTGEPQ